ncbi:MAG: phytoene/squalene synthase family protein [Candidatus Omnitrophota bacterium]
MDNQALKKSFLQAKKITQKHAKSFYFASSFLGKKERLAAYAVYAICRISDDSADALDQPLRLKALEKIASDIEAAYQKKTPAEGPLYAFQATVEQYKIPKTYFQDLLKGMCQDLEVFNYKNFDQLYQYCYWVAGVVGLIMLKIFDTDSEEAKKSAVSLGIAMQLTNILRDIKEDYQNKRLYLPEDEMARFGISSQSIASEAVDDKFKAFLKWQIQRARKYYQNSLPGIKMIPGWRSRLTVYLMKEIYAGILTALEKNGYDPFRRRAATGKIAKIMLLVKIIFSGKYL